MAHLLRQPLLLAGVGVLARPQRIAANTPTSSSLRAPTAGIGLNCLATMLMNDPGSTPAQHALEREQT
jgi:hypothetical protein